MGLCTEREMCFTSNIFLTEKWEISYQQVIMEWQNNMCREKVIAFCNLKGCMGCIFWFVRRHHTLPSSGLWAPRGVRSYPTSAVGCPQKQLYLWHQQFCCAICFFFQRLLCSERKVPQIFEGKKDPGQTLTFPSQSIYSHHVLSPSPLSCLKG